MTFSEAFVVEVSKWENWRWAISTLITILSIFGAAFWAQSIFNKNALKREDRDRQLNSLMELCEVLFSLRADLEIKSGELRYLMQKFNDLNFKLIHIKTLVRLHDLKLSSSLNNLESGFITYKEKLDYFINLADGLEDTEIEPHISDDMADVVYVNILGQLDQLLSDITMRFHEIKGGLTD